MFKRINATELRSVSRTIAIDVESEDVVILRNLPKKKPQKQMRYHDAKVLSDELIKNALLEIKMRDIDSLVTPFEEKKEIVGDLLNGRFFPAIEIEDDRVLVTGPSGSGKTTFSAEMIIHYINLFPERKVFIISSLHEDGALSVVEETYPENFVRFDLNDMFNDSENEIDPETLANSLVFFDDVDTLMDTHIRQAVLVFRDFLLEQHRHFGIYLLLTTHLMTNFRETRRLLNEARKVVVFPGSGADFHILNFLTKFVGMGMRAAKNIVNKIDNESKWTLVSKTSPLYMITENKISSI